MIAPVKVARSIIAQGLKRSCAYHITSHSTKRPSASVFNTSIVSPLREVTTSPGRIASPDGMFSTKPTKPTTLAFALRFARANIVPATTPAPPISMVISSMPAAGFIDIPPVSNTTPLPANAKGAAASSAPCHSKITNFEGLFEPCPTLKSAPIPSSLSRSSSKTSTFKPCSVNVSKCSANVSVVKIFAGMETRSRVRHTPSAIESAVAKSGRKSFNLSCITR